MEQTIKIKKMTCDNCDKEASQNIDEATIGGSPFNGWFRCEQINITSVVNPDKNMPIHKKTFCCQTCMTSYYQK